MINSSYDIAFGSRDIVGATIPEPQPWYRETAGKIFNRLVRVSTGLHYHDTQCGFKLFNMSRCKELFRRQLIEGYSYDVELLYIATKWGLRVIEVPILWRHSPGSKVGFMSDASRMFFDLLKIRWNDWTGQYCPRGDGK